MTKKCSWDLLVSSAIGVLRFEADTGIFKGIFASGGGLQLPTGLRFGPDGDLYVGNVGPDNVLRFEGKSGAFVGIAASHADLKHPRQVTFQKGKLLVSSRGADRVLSFELSGGAFKGRFSKAHTSYTVAGIDEDGLSQPFGLIFDPGGNLLVASYGTDSVRRYDGRTGFFIDTFACGNGLVQPRNIVYGPDNNLYVTSGNHRVLRFDGRTGSFIDTFVAPSSGGLSDPYGLEFGDDGDLYVISGGNNSVLRYDGVTGAFHSVFIASGTAGLNGSTYAAFFGGLGGAYNPEGWRAALQ